jgi:hypothetical protein
MPIDELNAASASKVLNIPPESLLVETLKIPDRKQREIVEAVGQSLRVPQFRCCASPTRRTPPYDVAMPGAQMKQRRVEQVSVGFLALGVHSTCADVKRPKLSDPARGIRGWQRARDGQVCCSEWSGRSIIDAS